jgi:hypothetical protein
MKEFKSNEEKKDEQLPIPQELSSSSATLEFKKREEDIMLTVTMHDDEECNKAMIEDDNDGVLFPFSKAKVSRFFRDRTSNDSIPQLNILDNMERRSTQITSQKSFPLKGSDNSKVVPKTSNPDVKQGMLYPRLKTSSNFVPSKNSLNYIQTRPNQTSEEYVYLPNYSNNSLISQDLNNMNINQKTEHYNPEQYKYKVHTPTHTSNIQGKIPLHSSSSNTNTHGLNNQNILHNPSDNIQTPKNIRAINKANTNQMINNIDYNIGTQYPFMMGIHQPGMMSANFPLPIYGTPVYHPVNYPYGFPMEYTYPQGSISYLQTIQNLHGYPGTKDATSSSKLSSSSGNKSEGGKYKLAKKGTNMTSHQPTINYNLMTLDEIQKCMSHLCKEQLGCRFLQSKVEETPNYAENYILPIIFNKLVDVINDQFGNYLIQKIVDTISPETLNSIFTIVSYLFNIYANS